VIADHAPGAIATSQDTLDRAVVQLNESSSDNLLLGTVFSAGVSLGLLIARAPRPLIALALSPGLLFGGMLVARRTDRVARDAPFEP
jgi:hypothetical protein